MATRARRQFQDCFTEILTGKTVTDVASIAAGGRATVAVTVTGVALGDAVLAVYSSADPGNAIMTAKVTAANVVTVALENNTALAVDPASMTYYVIVGKVNPALQL